MKLLKKLLQHKPVKIGVYSLISLLIIGGLILTANSMDFLKKQNGPSFNEAQQLNPGEQISYFTAEGMTCGSCAAKIEKALTPVTEIRNIEVDPTLDQVTLYHTPVSPDKIKMIEALITSTGYTGKFTKSYSYDEVQTSQKQYDHNNEDWVALIGDVPITREDFEIQTRSELTRYTKAYGKEFLKDDHGRSIKDSVHQKVIVRLRDQAYMLAGIKQDDFIITETQIDQAYQDYLNGQKISETELSSKLKKNGYSIEYFKAQHQTQTMIDRYIEERIYRGEEDGNERHQLFQTWLSGLQKTFRVQYLDQNVQQLFAADHSHSEACTRGNH